MKLSVVVPCYNESKTLSLLLNRVLRQIESVYEIIVVDDCSSDNSVQIVESLNDERIKVFRHRVNQGKGAALRTGFMEATGEVVLVQDADLEYDPSEYSKLLAPIKEGRADVVYGSRFTGGSEHSVGRFWHMIGNKILTLISNMMSNLDLTDMETCYKVFRSEIIKQIIIEEDRFGFEPEVTAKLAKMKISMCEVGIRYHGRSYDEGKKIGWRDGVRAIYCIFKYNLFVR
jgi:glycosyltransferase involved in cell wall biosynthesis